MDPSPNQGLNVGLHQFGVLQTALMLIYFRSSSTSSCLIIAASVICPSPFAILCPECPAPLQLLPHSFLEVLLFVPQNHSTWCMGLIIVDHINIEKKILIKLNNTVDNKSLSEKQPMITSFANI